MKAETLITLVTIPRIGSDTLWVLLNICWVTGDWARPASEWLRVPLQARVSGGLLQGKGPWQEFWEVQHVAWGLSEEVTTDLPAIEPQGERFTNRRAIMPKRFSQSCEGSRSQNRLPNLGIQQRDWGAPGDLPLKVSGIWLRNFHRPGERETPGGHRQTCVHQDPGEMSHEPTKDRATLAWESPGVSWCGRGQQWSAVGSGALAAYVLEVPITSITSSSLARGQNTGREHSLTHPQETELQIYWAWLCPSEQHPVFPTTSPSHKEAWINPLSSSIRGQMEWKLQSQKANQNDHMDHSFVWLHETISHAM